MCEREREAETYVALSCRGERRSLAERARAEVSLSLSWASMNVRIHNGEKADVFNYRTGRRWRKEDDVDEEIDVNRVFTDQSRQFILTIVCLSRSIVCRVDGKTTTTTTCAFMPVVETLRYIIQ